ncbi:MAG: M55 family metallopeptidase [Candidatus Saccharicenans sp.]|nr:M55 family metallopeptidase [Candidatus Saccharicenans sp.]MDH7493514.1 M55 family metallopeptidase [Candidatus Saccharicenans sp.]
MKRRINSLFLIAMLLLSALAVANQLSARGKTSSPPPLKVFVSVDMEGIWGVVHGNQCSTDSPEYQLARKWMVQDTNAVVQGLFDRGATEVVVNDSHGSMRNIIASELDPRAVLISGSPKPLSMMEGIDPSFAACIFVGYHARAGSAPAILDHTISGAAIYSIRINGIEMPELGINAALAGYFKVPVVMLTGDTETCRQARELLGKELVTVAVKEAVNRLAARNYAREKVLIDLREGARQALASLKNFKPYQLQPPYQFEINFHNSQQAELGMLIPGVQRPAPRTLTFTSKDYLEGFKLARALIALAGIS